MFDYNGYREIYLIFQDDIQYAGSRFMKKGFKHVFVLERQALGWTCVDPSRDDLHAMILPASWSIDIIPQFKKNNPDASILKLHVIQNNYSRYPRPSLVSCVSVIQYIIGVYWPHILTPYRLYNKIINNPPSHIEVIGHVRKEQGKT